MLNAVIYIILFYAPIHQVPLKHILFQRHLMYYFV